VHPLLVLLLTPFPGRLSARTTTKFAGALTAADAGERDDRLTTDERAELAALRKENVQLKRANDVLRTASAFFAAQLDPARPR
jgi:transposase-like protein